MIDGLKPYPTYKDSRVAWVGEVPAHWEVSKVKNLARPGYKTFVDGDWIESPYITDDGIRLIQTGNIGVGAYREKGFRYISARTFDAFACTEFQPGEVLICRLGEPVGRACLAPDLHVRMITSVDVCILKPRRDVLGAFVVYAMSSPQYLDWVNSLVRGSTRDRVSRTMLGSFTVPLPPPPEQTAIVRFLDYADRRIRRYIGAKRNLIALLNEQKQATIQHAVTRGLDPHVRLEPSGLEWLGEVPEHWEMSPAKYFYRETDERSGTGEEELLSVSHITGVTPRSQKSITMFMASSYVDHKLCKPGDLVINTMWAWMGALGVAKEAGMVSPSYGVYRPLKSSRSKLLGDYADLLLRTRPYINEYTCRSTGIRSSRLRLYPDQFLSIKLLCPPIEEQRIILDHVAAETSATERAIASAQREIDLFREYRSRLIADLVTGKFDVREAAAGLPGETQGSEPVEDLDAVTDGHEDIEEMDPDAAAEEAEA